MCLTWSLQLLFDLVCLLQWLFDLVCPFGVYLCSSCVICFEGKNDNWLYSTYELHVIYKATDGNMLDEGPLRSMRNVEP